MADTALGNGVELLQDIGFFDVVLPFILVFTIVFGVLEKTRIFGTEKISGVDFPKKNINAMVAFSVAFFVIAASEIVASLQEALPMVALGLVAIISLLMLVGSMVGGEAPFAFFQMFENDGVRTGFKATFAGIFIISIVLIFFNSFGWLEPMWDYINGIGNEVFIGVVFVVGVLILMGVIIGGGPKGDE